MSSGTFTLGGVFIFFLNGSPLLVWFAIFCVVLGFIFLVHVLMKRRKEAREAHGLVLPMRERIGT
jgi:hypothetical protein